MNLFNKFLQAVGVTVVDSNFVHLYGPTWSERAANKSTSDVMEMIVKSNLDRQIQRSPMPYGEYSYDKISYFEEGKERWFLQPNYNKDKQRLDVILVDYREGTKDQPYTKTTVACFALGTPTNTITHELTMVLLDNLGKDQHRRLMAAKLIEDAEFAPKQG